MDRVKKIVFSSPLLIFLLLPLSLGGCASAPPPNVPRGALQLGQEQKAHLLSLDKVGAYAGAGYLFTQQDQSVAAIQRTEHQFQERAGLSAAGSVYTPNFLRYELTGVGGLVENWTESSTESVYDTGTLDEFDTSLHLFPRRFHPTSLYFSRVQEIQPQVFFSKFESTTTTLRGEQQINLANGSFRLFGGRREIDQTSVGTAFEQAPFLDVREDSAGASGDWRLGPHQTVSGSYNVTEVKESEEKNSFTANAFEGNHALSLGPADQHQLRSRVEANIQEGSLDQRLLRVDELFTSEITERLRGDAGLDYEKNDTNLVKIEQVQGRAGLSHRLFESLTTSIAARGGRLTTDGVSTTDTMGATVGLNYQKKDPLGVFRLGYGNSLERRFVTNDQGGAVDEPHRFPDVPPEETRLLHAQIDPASIVITDPSGLIFYAEGIDYTLSQDLGGFTIIARVFTGRIPVGGEILVDYTFEVGADYTLDSMIQNLRIEHEFLGGLTPYFAFLHQDQNVVDEDRPGAILPVRERGLIGGLEWRRRTFTVGGEYENRESTILPFDAVRLRGQVSQNVGEFNQVIGNATQAWLFYQEPARDVSIAQGNVRWQSTITRSLRFFLDGAVHYDKDSLQGESYGYTVGGGVEYKWRKFLMRLRTSHRETHGTSDFREEEVGIFIVREFGSATPSLTAAEERFLRQ